MANTTSAPVIKAEKASELATNSMHSDTVKVSRRVLMTDSRRDDPSGSHSGKGKPDVERLVRRPKA